MRRALALSLILMFAGPVGCAPVNWIRDDYAGRDIFEPGRANKPVERDEYGNPILKKR